MLFLPKEGADAIAGTNEGASGLKSSLGRVKCPIGVYGGLIGAIVERQLKCCGGVFHSGDEVE